ncbi:YdeI family protein [Sungkyunkwania multivorans]|uniref:YdeI family protein n=1 Tax=Sungkyunkwania multivorans TaxID=1173618 RepID=A0ABW3D2N5_9FLAO
MKKYSTVDDYISAQGEWIPAINMLRAIFDTTEMIETLKWSIPTYTVNGKNVAGIGAFKSYVGIWFFQGVFLKDEKNVLINAQEEKTVALRQWRFQSIEEIAKQEKPIKAYLHEAIQNQKDGKEIKPQKKKTASVPPELVDAFSRDASLKIAFDKFTPFKQREFSEYIAAAKREATKLSRLEKIIPMIKDGIGLNDKYRNC